jgi:hypothetical protein
LVTPKISTRFLRDCEIYKRWQEEVEQDLCLHLVPKELVSSDGHSAIETMFLFDTHGDTVTCREPEELTKLVNGKAGLNLQIKQWAAGIKEGLFGIEEFQISYPWLPSWVWDSVRKQSKRGKDPAG